jgi:FAD synthase
VEKIGINRSIRPIIGIGQKQQYQTTIVQIESSLANILTPTAIALGNFDGIHRGHLEVIRPVLIDNSGAYKTVVSFDPDNNVNYLHPIENGS